MDALYSQRCQRCGGTHPTAEGGLSLDMDALLEKAIKLVYKDKAAEMLPQLGQAVAAQLSGGVQKGYGNGPLQVEWESPDWKMIQHLQKNVYEFSFAKSHEQLKALTLAMFDKETGKIIPFKEFKEVATRINNEMAVRHLKVEYETAIAGGQMASRWTQFEQDKEQFPNLTYQTVGDGRVRESHKVLHNITRPMDDAFWKSYYPPNGWGCRCDVIQAVGRAVTAPERIQTPTDVPPMFQTNLAERGLAFPKGHPFFKHLPESVKEAANGQNPFLYEKAYDADGEGYVYQNKLHTPDTEELTTAQRLADKGERVIFLPEIKISEGENATAAKAKQLLRDMTLPPGVAEKRKNPDCRIGKEVVELKTANGSRTSIERQVREGAEQAQVICIRLGKEVKPDAYKPWLGTRARSGTQFKEVWIMQPDGSVEKYTHRQAKTFKTSKGNA